MSLICHSCAGDANETHVKCGGFCKAIFHPKCTGLSADALEMVKDINQVFWFCPSCTSLMKDMRFRNTVQAAQEAGHEQASNYHGDILAQLKSEILTELKSEIQTNFTKLMNSNLLTPKATNRVILEPRFTKKRRLFSMTNDSVPVTKPNLLLGTGSTLSPSSEIKTVPKPQPKFWLYLSRIAPDVSADQIGELTKKRLETNDVQVARLVPKGRDISSLSFVSFKIGINAELKSRALLSSTWPKGILYREFCDDNSRENFWRPKPPPATNDPLGIPAETEMVVIE